MRKVDPASSQWDTTAELLAGLIEVVDFGNRMFHAANMKGSPPEPVVINRPGTNGTRERRELDEPKRMASAAEMKKWFGGAVEYTP